MPTLIKRTLSLVTCASWKSPDDEFMFINTHECSAFWAKTLPSDMALIRLFIGLAMISTIQTSTRISLNQNGYSNILFAVSPEVPPSESEKIIENIQVIYFKFKWNEWRTICEFLVDGSRSFSGPILCDSQLRFLLQRHPHPHSGILGSHPSQFQYLGNLASKSF